VRVVLILGGFRDTNVILTIISLYFRGDVPPVSLLLGVDRLRFGRSMGGRSFKLEVFQEMLRGVVWGRGLRAVRQSLWHI
jgi:hypothetical protein